MKKFVEICEEIKKEIAKKSTKAADAQGLALEELRQVLRAYHNGEATEEEKQAAKEKEQRAAQAMQREEEKNEAHKLAAAIMRDNAKQAFFADYIGIICEIWNKYAGKPHGEKTADKIRSELRAATGQGVYICNEYKRIKISIYTAQGVPVPNFEIGESDPRKEPQAIDENNKILKIDPESFRVWYCGDYVENIPEHIKALKKAHKAARDAYEKAQELVSAYNKLTRGEIKRENIREGVSHCVMI